MPLYTKEHAQKAIEAALDYINENSQAIENPDYDEGYLQAYSYLINKVKKLPTEVYKEIICFCVEVYPLVRDVVLENGA